MARFTGKAGTMTWNTVVLPVVEAGHKIARTMADATDSSSFDPTTNQLFKTQLVGDNQLTLTLKGYFDSTTTPGNIYGAMISDATVNLVTKISGTNQVVNGIFDISDWESTVTVPGGVMVDWNCTAMSNGPYHLG